MNTAVGVAAIDKDHLNVAKALKLGWFKRIWKIVLPSSLPLIFTGLRVSIGVGWMVLVAAPIASLGAVGLPALQAIMSRTADRAGELPSSWPQKRWPARSP